MLQGNAPFGRADSYQKLEQLGEGSYATVYKGISRYGIIQWSSVNKIWPSSWTIVFFCFFSIRLLSVLRGYSGFFIPATTANDLRLQRIYTRSYPLHYFLILFLEKEPVFHFLMFSAKQGNHWYHFYSVFGMTRSLTGDRTRDLPHSKPALYY